MPRNGETSVNVELGLLLRDRLPTASVSWQNSRVIAEDASFQPDVLVTAPDRTPLVIEAEYEPGRNVEAEATARLGFHVRQVGHPIETVIAVLYPLELEEVVDVTGELRRSRLRFCVHYDDGSRFPETGFVEGSVDDLADMVRTEAVPKRAATLAADQFQLGIDLAEPILRELQLKGSGAVGQIARYLGLSNVQQTQRMACAIVLNAIVFHEHLAGFHRFDPFSKLANQHGGAGKDEVIAVWDEILEIDYWPIFATARTVVNELPAPYAQRLLSTLYGAAEKFTVNGLSNSQDLTGRVFQRLISDRQYLATYYTLPASATLLASLALSKVGHVDWGDGDSVGSMAIADFACGTGALLSAIYREVINRYELSGRDASELHAPMLESVLTGCDVMPSAVHITGSTLSGMQPQRQYAGTNLFTMPYGRRRGDEVAIGSLELLNQTSILALFNTSAPALRTGPHGQGDTEEYVVDIPDRAFDVVIMNPPYTSNTKHRDAEAGVRAAAFAAYETTESDQSAMASKLRHKASGTCYHGHAGLGSAFAALADAKVKPGGIIAFVLPLTALNGSSWRKFREMLTASYTNLSVITLTGDDGKIAFSSDTSIAECLVVARKLKPDESPSSRAQFVSLRRRPENVAQAMTTAKQLNGASDLRSLEDGPYGGSALKVGDEVIGEAIVSGTSEDGSGFGCARLRDAAVGQTAYALSNRKLWLPSLQPIEAVPLVRLFDLADRGPDSQMFIGKQHRGPFDKQPYNPNATYPALWNRKGHDEASFVYQPDSDLVVRPGMEDRANELWHTASRVHIAREFGFNQDTFGAVFTVRPTVGGRSWPSMKLHDPVHEIPVVLWLNSTLGLLTYWWSSSRQQGARGGLTITQMSKLVVPDFRTFTDEQFAAAESLFERFRGAEFKVAFKASNDADRAELDESLVCEVLGLGADVYDAVRLLAGKWCAEPSVHGGRKRVNGG